MPCKFYMDILERLWESINFKTWFARKMLPFTKEKKAL